MLAPGPPVLRTPSLDGFGLVRADALSGEMGLASLISVASPGGGTMPKASKSTASESVMVEGYEGHFEHFAGGYTAGFETYTADVDLTPFFAGLPDDRCQCEHWGYVVKGKVTFKTAEGDETFEAGDAYYAAPGHTPVLYSGTEIVEFSPTAALQQTLEVVSRNMEASGE
jgi:hypothetical protein